MALVIDLTAFQKLSNLAWKINNKLISYSLILQAKQGYIEYTGVYRGSTSGRRGLW